MHDDITIHTSNLSADHNEGLNVNSISDDDPNPHVPEKEDRSDEYIDPSILNSVRVCDTTFVPNSDVYDGDLPMFQESEQDANLYRIDSDHQPFDSEALRAQIDTGTSASVTDRIDLLHFYREFDETFRCPIKLLPATEGSDTVPIGVGYLMVPAPGEPGFIMVRTFFHPNLRTTVIRAFSTVAE